MAWPFSWLLFVRESRPVTPGDARGCKQKGSPVHSASSYKKSSEALAEMLRLFCVYRKKNTLWRGRSVGCFLLGEAGLSRRGTRVVVNGKGVPSTPPILIIKFRSLSRNAEAFLPFRINRHQEYDLNDNMVAMELTQWAKEEAHC